ncbi:hypothetical protein JGH54_000641 [Listeria monocytogenes]|nr:hypothetical protein [Listeria monocytogenes]EGW0545413.1 hypothetical protein [Listeria monocytogenes]
MGLFSVDEQNLLVSYDTSSREKLLSDLEESLPYIYNRELISIINSIIYKLKLIDDHTFNTLSLDFTGFFNAKND